MTYTPNVPLGNQQIANTQVPILNNFEYIQSTMIVDHSWNGTTKGGIPGTHNQASMPNQTDLTSLIAGTNGAYYVSGGLPKFFNNIQLAGLQLLGINAFIQFNGNGSVGALNAGGNSIRASYNINPATSTNDGTGLYTITFTNALASANYVVLITGMRNTSGNIFGFVQSDGTYSDKLDTTGVSIGFVSDSGTAHNVLMGSVLIFGA
jgi:hypothetical protein